MLEPAPVAVPRRWSAVSRTVVLLGMTSLLTDVSSEPVTAVLPLYFMLELRMTPLQFGLLDGLYQGSSALVRVPGGLVADAGRRYKPVAFVGYALSAFCKLGLLLVGSAWAPIAALLMIDRLGKGVRTAPRDALITLSSEPARLGEAFGAHRAMDTVGAVVGPVLAFAVLAAAPGAYDAVFVMSFAVALSASPSSGSSSGTSAASLAPRRMARTPAPGCGPPSRAGSSGARRRGGVLGLLTASDALIYLLLQRRGAVPTTLFPLLFVGTALVYLFLALPVGRLADRWGRHRGFSPDMSSCSASTCPDGHGASPCRDRGVRGAAGRLLRGDRWRASALASSVLQEQQLTTGLAVVSTITALARLLASSLFGAVWNWWGPTEALEVFAAGLVVAGALAAGLLRIGRPWTPAAVE